VHVVKRGETLYGIASRYGLDFREVAKLNGITSPYVIRPGQRLRITSGALPSSPATTTSASTGVPTQPRKVPQSTTRPAASTNDSNVSNAAITRWAWPASGEVLTSFDQSGSKGIDIAGQLGHPVKAAADGRVVYSGGGLIGYGELIIIKHNKHYLSAYGHNEKLLVKQGDLVTIGQHIATMGDSGTDRVKLHFEIRRDGKPVDPIRYLPK
jgi:lipoprotein NlpD